VDVGEDELRARLNLLEPGARVTETNLRRNADAIQTYLRERGFYRANVEFSQTPAANGLRTAVTFRVQPGVQATVESFAINIPGFDATDVRKRLRLQPGEEFSIARLTEDVARVRQAIIREDFLAPVLNEPQFTLDAERNTFAVSLTGSIGPKVEVEVEGFRHQTQPSARVAARPARRQHRAGRNRRGRAAFGEQPARRRLLLRRGHARVLDYAAARRCR
jgi:outer membrane protein assembly factor BamA